MPNWCNNNVELSHADKIELEKARAAYLDGTLLEYWHPVPKELMEKSTSFRSVDEYTEEDKSHIEKYGAVDGYTWRINNWGTKWDVNPDVTYDADQSGLAPIHYDGEKYVVNISFDTAWAPAIPAYEHAVKKGYEITAYYIEWGMMFCGKWHNGHDENYQIEDISDLPEDIINEFDIINSLKEFEEMFEENKEEEK